MNPIKVEVGQYREVNKGSLKAFFSLVIYPMGQKILDCRYFVQGEKRWFNLPQKEIKYSDGRKTEYIPLISYLQKDYFEKLKEAVLEQLQKSTPQENHVQKKSTSPTRYENPLPLESSFSWDAPLF